MSQDTAADPHLQSAIKKSTWRLLPILILMYVAAFVDRSNVSFAKVELQSHLGLADAAFAMGAGIFFLSYVLFEVPSNLLLHRVGARVWLPRIMVTWGLVSAATAFVGNEFGFYAVRILLGIAEAGFFPGVIYFVSLWFPRAVRGRILGLFYFGFPLAMLLGNPLSGILMDLPATLGIAGWQWMFVIEGLLASVIGVIAWFVLVPSPSRATWLTAKESDALQTALLAEAQTTTTHGRGIALFADIRIWLFVAIYFTIQVSVYGIVFYLPTTVAALLGTKVGLQVGLLTAIPWFVALLTTRLITVYADRTHGHRYLAVAMLILAALGISSSIATTNVPLVILAFSIAMTGFVAVQPLFWTQPSDHLSGAMAAAGIALINGIGNLGGFFAPNLRQAAEKHFGTPAAGVLILASVAAVGAVHAWTSRSKPSF